MTVGEQEFRGTERFRIQRRLGAGGFGVVYQVFDQQRGEDVALKALRDGNVEALFRLKREFRALADIAHPNLVRLHELLGEEEQWFFTMELIDGINFLQFARGTPFRDRSDSTDRTAQAPSPEQPDAPPEMTSGEARELLALGLEGSDPPSIAAAPTLDTERLRLALKQAVTGIQAIHRTGQLHRDVKPSNVLVAPDGRVVLLDFGMLTDLSLTGSKRSISVVGTPAYMSPEQGSARPLSEPTDWYSLGVMLFEALTGQWPFTGGFIEMMWDKRHKDAAAPRDLVPGVPDDLNALCVDLMRREPSQRPSGDEILARLGAVQAATYRAQEMAQPASAGPPFVGREEHLAALQSALQA